MYFITTPYLTPSGRRLSNHKIIIYEISTTSSIDQIRHITRKFELTSKGWKVSKHSGRCFYPYTHSLNDASIVDMSSHHSLFFDTFDNAYAAKCILINRIPSLFLSKIQALTSKMGSIKQVQPQLHFMSDAVPELFL